MMPCAFVVAYLSTLVYAYDRERPTTPRQWASMLLVAALVAWVLAALFVGILGHGFDRSIDPNAGQHM